MCILQEVPLGNSSKCIFLVRDYPLFFYENAYILPVELFFLALGEFASRAGNKHPQCERFFLALPRHFGVVRKILALYGHTFWRCTVNFGVGAHPQCQNLALASLWEHTRKYGSYGPYMSQHSRKLSKLRRSKMSSKHQNVSNGHIICIFHVSKTPKTSGYIKNPIWKSSWEALRVATFIHWKRSAEKHCKTSLNDLESHTFAKASAVV